MEDHLLQEAKRHFNEPILVNLAVGRCVGFAEDEDDCYLIVRYPRQRLRRCTFVGGYTYLDCLKGQSACKSSETGEVWDDFTRLDSLLSLNGASKEAEFIVEIKAEPVPA